MVSIIIPFYNRSHLLCETLLSIQRQLFKDFEVLIIDDGSEEQEIKQLEKFLSELGDSRIQLFGRPANFPKGANGCRAYGLSIAKGEFVKWFDSDDLMDERLLEIQVKQMHDYGFDGVLCNCDVWNEDFTAIVKSGWRKRNFSSQPLQDYLKTQLAWQTGCGLWKRSAVTRLEPFTERITNAQEWIFHLKALVYGMHLGISNLRLVRIRRHEGSISAQRKKAYFQNRLKARLYALAHLVRTGNKGKRFLMKSVFNMLFSARLYTQRQAYAEFGRFFIALQNAVRARAHKPVKVTLIDD